MSDTATGSFEEQVVDGILEDMTDRRGLRQAWDDIDTDIQKEIRATWTAIVRAAMKTCRSCNRPTATTSTLCRYCDNDE